MGVQTLTAGGTGNGAAQNPYAFHAGIKDPGSGLVKFGQRWYNPTTGTWTQQDTLDAPLDPANANRYAYAGDDPINNLDPTGEYLSSCTTVPLIWLSVLSYSALATGVLSQLLRQESQRQSELQLSSHWAAVLAFFLRGTTIT